MNFLEHALDLSKYVWSFAVAYGITLLLVPLVIRLAPSIGMIDVPDARRVHKTPTPRGGGMALWIGFHIAFVSTLFLFPVRPTSLNFDWWQGFLIGSGILFLVGVIDDSRGLPPLVKLGGQAAAAICITAVTGTEFSGLLGFELPAVVNFVVTIFWYLAFINAFNLIDGLDGLCSGLAMIGALGLGASFIALRGTLDMLAPLALSGACLAFLRFNFHPAKIFLGDTGSMFLGFALASFALETSGKSTVVVTLGVALLSAGIPLFDTALAIWRRSMRKILAGSGSVMGADKEHLHHRLLDSGLSTRRVALSLYFCAAFLVVAGILSLVLQRAALGLYLVTIVAAIYVVVRHIAHVELWDTGKAIARGLVKPRIRALATVFYLLWDLMAIAFSLAVSFILLPIPEVERSIGTKEEWIRALPSWILPVFISLILAKTYRRVWSKAGAKDFFALQAAIIVGVIFVFVWQVLMLSGWDRIMLTRCLVFGGSLYLLVILGRSASQVLRLLMQNALKSGRKLEAATRKVLLYGASERCLLYLRKMEDIAPDFTPRGRVLGIIDDDESLRRRIIKGHEVLGNLDDLPELVRGMKVDEIVVVCPLEPARRERLKAIAETYELKVTEWSHRYESIHRPEASTSTDD